MIMKNYQKTLLTSLALSAVIQAQNAETDNNSEASETIVTAQAPVTEKSAATSISVVNGKDIQISGASSVPDALKSIPGVTLGRGSGGRQEVLLRGLSAEFGLVLIDGQRVPHTDRQIPFTTNRFDLVSTDDIERVEVLRGASSNLHGADAMSGVINIITKKPTKEWKTNLSFKLEDTADADGQNHIYNFSTSGALTDALSLRLGYERKSESPIRRDGLDQTADRGIDRFWLRGRYDFSDTGHIGFDYLRIDEEGSEATISRGAPSTLFSDQILDKYTLSYKDKVCGFNLFGALNYSQNKSGKLKDDVWNVNDYGALFLADGAVGDDHYLSMGVILRKQEADRASRNFDESTESLNLHIQDRWKISDKMALTFGGAADVHSEYGSEFSPKVALNYSVTDRLDLKFSYAQSYSAPALREASSSYVISAGPTRTYIGNDDLQPETVESFEAGFYYEAEKQSASFTVFHNSIDDLITTVNRPNTGSPVPGAHFAEYTNVEQAKVSGVEAHWKYRFTENTNLALNYTFLDTEDNEGRELTRRPDHTLAATVQHNTEWLGGLDLYGSVRYVGAQVNSHAEDFGFTTVPFEELDSHFVVDLALSKDITENFSLNAGVDNIFNDSVYEQSGDAYQQGRTFWIKSTFHF